jgi:hypothetical protein
MTGMVLSLTLYWSGSSQIRRAKLDVKSTFVTPSAASDCHPEHPEGEAQTRFRLLAKRSG